MGQSRISKRHDGDGHGDDGSRKPRRLLAAVEPRMKPHLTLFISRAWMCDGWGYVGFGATLRHAYDDWFHRLPPHKAQAARQLRKSA